VLSTTEIEKLIAQAVADQDLDEVARLRQQWRQASLMERMSDA